LGLHLFPDISDTLQTGAELLEIVGRTRVHLGRLVVDDLVGHTDEAADVVLPEDVPETFHVAVEPLPFLATPLCHVAQALAAFPQSFRVVLVTHPIPLRGILTLMRS